MSVMSGALAPPPVAGVEIEPSVCSSWLRLECSPHASGVATQNTCKPVGASTLGPRAMEVEVGLVVAQAASAMSPASARLARDAERAILEMVLATGLDIGFTPASLGE
ncbi:hypothetical protein GCM10011367_18220 [Marinicauda pacifica]|nr:hypothetical protein GCM10011367_18220 [Marinicauda pacifica]